MATEGERITQLENSVVNLAANKVDITDYNTINGQFNTLLLDISAALTSLTARVSSLEQYIASNI